LLVVEQRTADVEQGGLYERASQRDPLLRAEVMLGLRQREPARQEVLARVERGRIVPVVVVNVDGDALPGQKDDELGIEVDLTEEVQGVDGLDGEHGLVPGEVARGR